MTQRSSKKQPGDTLLGFAVTLTVIAVGMFVLAAIGGRSGTGLTVLLLMAAFAFALIGYLQRIAARR